MLPKKDFWKRWRIGMRWTCNDDERAQTLGGCRENAGLESRNRVRV